MMPIIPGKTPRAVLRYWRQRLHVLWNVCLNSSFVTLIVLIFHAEIPQNSDNKPWDYICSKGFFAGLIFGEAYFRRGLLLEGILHFKMGWGLE